MVIWRGDPMRYLGSRRGTLLDVESGCLSDVAAGYPVDVGARYPVDVGVGYSVDIVVGYLSDAVARYPTGLRAISSFLLPSLITSPSKLLATNQEQTLDIPLPDPAFLYPTPASPTPSDSLDALLNIEKTDLEEDSLSSRGKKRGRDGGDTASDTLQTQRRRSTKNPRIGSGFNNRPEDPVQIADEEGVADVGGNMGSG
ncbi:hypothetical protein QYF36_002441 [Acer negundo]|nr:hypothetical protein QYF36_002441 [Acer negundo]